jgi:Tfp pilus assembly protein PilO
MAVNFSWLKVYLLPAFIIFVAVYTAVAFIYPAVEQIKIAREENAVLEDRRQKLAAKAEILAKVSEAELKTDLAAAEISLPTDKNPSGIIFGLETLAASAGAKLTGFSTVVGKLATASAVPLPESSSPAEAPALKESEFPFQVKYLSVELGLAGDYEQIRSFVNSLLPVNRLLGVEKISLDEKDKKLILMVFYQPLLRTLGDVASPVEDITPEERTFLRQAAEYRLATPPLLDLPTGKQNPFQ